MTRIAAKPAVSRGLWTELSEFYRDIRDSLGVVPLPRQEIAIYSLFGVILAIALTCQGLNFFFYHFSLWQLNPKTLISVSILLIIWLFIGHIHRMKWPRIGLLSKVIAQTGLWIIVSSIGCISIITTPNPIIDYYLAHFDRLLGFDVTALMAWTHQYPALIKVLTFSYDSWYLQLMIIPVILALLKKSNEINQYFMASLLCFIFSALIYYFFPTIAPAGIMHSPYFTENQYNLVTRFYEIHQRLPVSVASSGLVAFPSCHVMFGLLWVVAMRNVKIIFYPLLILNSLLIFATMALGYHYLADVLVSIPLVGLALLLVHIHSLGAKKSS